VSDPHRFAGDRVHGRAVGRAVVGQQPLNDDAVAGIERNGATQKADDRDGFLVG
jgi:hypothetical protein